MDSNLLADTGSKLTNIVKRHQRIKFMVPELDGKLYCILREVSFELTLQFVKTISNENRARRSHSYSGLRPRI